MLVFSYSNMIKKSTDHVSVYGALHSPWLQAVLLGLHEKGISHSLQPIPSLRLLINSGVMMPAAKINHGPWQLDSEEILKSLGFKKGDFPKSEEYGKTALSIPIHPSLTNSEINKIVNHLKEFK